MKFTLPPVHDIVIEIDGRRFDGSWYVILRDMIVNYNGYTVSTHERSTDADVVARRSGQTGRFGIGSLHAAAR